MAQSRKKTHFLIVDGHALLHRAWHALPPLTTSKGEIVHGAYGFTTIMLGAIKQFEPDYMAVTFDLKGPTFRHEQYEEYKAQREKKPEELYSQVAVIEKILAAMRIPVFTARGFEADDVIGTLSRMAAEQDEDVRTIIVTGDLDTLQLVDDRTKVFALRKGMSDTVLYDKKAVRERYGLDPTQLVDYKAFRGDPSDNIPGVKGIGEKTAADLVSTFGSLDAVYASLAKDDKKAKALKPSVREKLLAHKDDAFKARELCRIRRDVPLDFDLRSSTFTPPSREQVTPVFTELEFMKLLKQFPGGEGKPEAPAAKPRPAEPTLSLFPEAAASGGGIVRVADVKAFASLVDELSKARTFAFRTVVDADPAVPKIAVLGLASGGKVYAVDRSVLVAADAPLARLFAAKARKVCHDLKREHKALAGLGVRMDGPFFDLMIASYLLHAGERRHGLTAILAYRRGVPLDDAPADRDRLAVELPHFLSLADEFGRELEAHKLMRLNDEIEIPLAEALAEMERAGVAVDVPYFAALSKEVGKALDKLTARIYKLAGEEFNLNSPMQLKVVLFERLGISPEGLKKTEKGRTLSTAASELEKLRDQHPIIGLILEYRELAKLKSTYIDALPGLVHPKTGRIHADFNQAVTATGRLSSSNPNLQNIPTPETEQGKKVRDGFVAPRGSVLVACDYSQIELRIAAHIAKEKDMIKAFRDGEDIHWRTAVEMWGEEEAATRRRIAKVINFGILYGMGAQRLAESAGISFVEAREYIDRYFAIHKGIAAYMDEIKAKILADGYVETLFGRKRFFKNVHLMNPRERAEAERQAVNMPIQGTQADMIKIAMVRIHARLREKYGRHEDAPAKMLMQVHDELVFEVKKDAAEGFAEEAVGIMSGVARLSVPVLVNVSMGKRWGEMEKLR